MKQFLLFLFILIGRFVFSQSLFEDGYIINNKGDTIRGKIKDRKYIAGDANADKIKFIDTKGNKSKIEADEIKEYRRKGNIVFRTLPIGRDAKMQFAQIVETGAVILYSYTSGALISFTEKDLNPQVSNNNVAQKKIVPQYFYQRSKDPNSLMKVKKDKFESVSLFYFKDDTALIKKIEDKSLKYQDIRKVVQVYNEYTANKH